MKHVSDSHKLVEHIMIMTNHAVGKFLMKHKIPLLRTQAETTSDIPNHIASLPSKVGDHIKHRRCNAATYQYLSSNLKSHSVHSFHSGLGLNCYTHFTSPIRRYFDIIVHRLIKNIISNGSTEIPTP